MTKEEVKKEILKMYYDENMFGEDYINLIDKIYDEVELQAKLASDCSGCIYEPETAKDAYLPMKCGSCNRFYTDKKEK